MPASLTGNTDDLAVIRMLCKMRLERSSPDKDSSSSEANVLQMSFLLFLSQETRFRCHLPACRAFLLRSDLHSSDRVNSSPAPLLHGQGAWTRDSPLLTFVFPVYFDGSSPEVPPPLQQIHTLCPCLKKTTVQRSFIELGVLRAECSLRDKSGRGSVVSTGPPC